jgi:hypothetical protein
MGLCQPVSNQSKTFKKMSSNPTNSNGSNGSSSSGGRRTFKCVNSACRFRCAGSVEKVRREMMSHTFLCEHMTTTEKSITTATALGLGTSSEGSMGEIAALHRLLFPRGLPGDRD